MPTAKNGISYCMSTVNKSTSGNRFAILDALRGIAATAVMLFHFLGAYHHEFGYATAPAIGFEWGFYGVQLFFIISGFVIYYSISASSSIKDFLVKRFIRLYPTYWLCMAITFAVVSLFGLVGREAGWKDALVNISMFQGVFHVKFVDPSYWSLSIELFFYLFIALVFYINWQRFMSAILVGWLLLIVLYNFVFKIPGAGLFFNLQYGMLFVAGIAFYRIKIQKQTGWFNHALILASYLLCLAVLKHMDGFWWGITTVYILVYLAIYGKLWFIENRFFFFFGRISYALYLIHDNVGLVLLQEFKKHGYASPWLALFPIMISVLLGWLITDFFEKAVTGWMRRKWQAMSAASGIRSSALNA